MHSRRKRSGKTNWTVSLDISRFSAKSGIFFLYQESEIFFSSRTFAISLIAKSPAAVTMFKMLTCFSSPRLVNQRVSPEISSDFTHCLDVRNKHVHRCQNYFCSWVFVRLPSHDRAQNMKSLNYTFLKSKHVFRAQTRQSLDQIPLVIVRTRHRPTLWIQLTEFMLFMM